MTHFSDDRISHLSHLICDSLKDVLVRDPDAERSSGLARDREPVGGSGDLRRNPPLRDDKAAREIKRTLIEYFRVEDEADQAAREKVASLKRGVAEGSREWEILYRKYVEEELSRRGR